MVIVYLLNSNRQDRIEYRKERDENRVALREIRDECGKELAELRERVDQLEDELENERKLRYAAEANAASERLRAATAEHHMMLLRPNAPGGHDDQRGA